MKILTLSVLGLALIGTLSGPVFAQSNQEGSPLTENDMIYASQDGKMVRKKVTDPAMVEMMTKGATPVSAGTMLMMHGGKLFMIPDRRMTDGKMLSETVMK